MIVSAANGHLDVTHTHIKLVDNSTAQLSDKTRGKMQRAAAKLAQVSRAHQFSLTGNWQVCEQSIEWMRLSNCCHLPKIDLISSEKTEAATDKPSQVNRQPTRNRLGNSRGARGGPEGRVRKESLAMARKFISHCTCRCNNQLESREVIGAKSDGGKVCRFSRPHRNSIMFDCIVRHGLPKQ